MSVFIEFEIEVSGHDPAHEQAVLDAMRKTAPIDVPDDYHYGVEGERVLVLAGQGSCSYSSLEKDVLKQEIVPAITAANGGKAPMVEATVRWLENCPYDSFYLAGYDDDDEETADA